LKQTVTIAVVESGEKATLAFSNYKTPVELYDDLKRRRDEILAKPDIVASFTLYEEADEADLAAEKKKKKDAAAKKGGGGGGGGAAAAKGGAKAAAGGKGGAAGGKKK